MSWPEAFVASVVAVCITLGGVMLAALKRASVNDERQRHRFKEEDDGAA